VLDDADEEDAEAFLPGYAIALLFVLSQYSSDDDEG
jgi:hypothetical protein